MRADERTASYGVTGSIVPARMTSAYRVGLIVVTIAMLVLPLIYLGIIAAAARLLWWHTTNNTWILTSRGGGLWKLVGYFGPAAAGAVVVFFMIKPILARPARGVDPLPLEPEAEPALYQFIRAICRQVGAPFPARVQVDCQINASAGFARVPWTPRTPDLVLTIGLPLAAGLSVRQFAGVLAHEFGHFAQSGGMRLTFIVRAISHWLARVAHERDQWDEKLEEWASSGTWVVVLTFQIARAAVWISRMILSGLMRAGHVISSFMLRQMEYDADGYEVRLVGTTAFISTSTRLRELNAGAQFGYQDLQNAWARRMLPSNMASYLLGHTEHLPEGLLTEIRQLPEHKTSLFDTHPSDADRAAAAEALATDGVFVGGSESAVVLFRDFESLAVDATKHLYRHDFGLDLSSATLLDSDAAIKASRTREQWQVSIDALFGDTVSFSRAVSVPWPVAPMTVADATNRLHEARAALERDREAATERVRRFEELTHSANLAATALEVLQAGFTQIVPEDFQLTSTTGEDAAPVQRAALAARARLEPELQRHEALAAERIACALALLAHHDVRTGSDGERSTYFDEVPQVVAALNALAAVWPAIIDAYHVSLTSELVEGNAAKSPDQMAATRQTARLASRVHEHIRRIRAAVGAGPGPAGPAVTLASLLGFAQKGDELPDAATLTSAAVAVRFDLLGKLAVIVLKVESLLEAR